MTDAKIGYGSILKRGNGGSPEVFTAIKETVTFGLPKPESDDVEVTHLTSPNRKREYIAGLIENGEVQATMNWIPNDPTQDHLTGLLADQKSGVVRNWQALVGTTPIITWSFSGYVKSFAPDDVEAASPLRATLTIKVTGDDTIA